MVRLREGCHKMDDFDRKNNAQWNASIKQVFGVYTPRSAQWTNLDAIRGVLSYFMGENLNHTMLPTSGGMDMNAIGSSPEPGCLEFSHSNQFYAYTYTFRPAVLLFEYFPESPPNSFFLLETQQLQPCGVYKKNSGNSEEVDETVVEFAPAKYIDIACLDTGILGYNEEGDEIPLPLTMRIVSRYMKGKFLVVAKRSIWNNNPATYDGRHNQMTAEEIRTVIQRNFD